jgi:hypothetical protein
VSEHLYILLKSEHCGGAVHLAQASHTQASVRLRRRNSQ